MTQRRLVSTILMPAVLVLTAFSVPVEKLPIGSKAPMTETKMTGTDGTTYSIASTAQENGVIVMFSCNTCPWVKAWQDRYNKVAKTAEEHDVGMLVVNANAAYRNKGDGMADMKQQAKTHDYPFPYVLDEDATLADAFGATKTPDVFLFDGSMKLVYRGAIDDNARNAEAVENHYLRTAIEAVANGTEVEPKTTKSLGCTIKRAD